MGRKLMHIQIGSGVGLGPTKMAAFDAALHQAGVANYNLLRLSSVIPADSHVALYDKQIATAPGEWGDRLYVVMAETRIDTPNAEAWAGLGWVQDKETGRGLFVENEGGNERAVRRNIRQGLKGLIATRKTTFGPIQMKVVGGTCEHESICALVIAVYKAEG